MSLKLTKNLRFAKVGQEVIVPLGWYVPCTLKVEEVGIDRETDTVFNQLFANCTVITGDGWNYPGKKVSICLGWRRKGKH